MTALDELKKHSIVVADTADFGLLKKFAPEDATTNPSLVLAGSKLPQYRHLVEAAVNYGKTVHTNPATAGLYPNTPEGTLDATIDKLTVSFGAEILKIVPGRVSTEVDAKFSFDKDNSVKKARRIVDLYKDIGYGKDRLYIKLAATWEGIQAARELEADGIQCNLTLLFSFAQALACAQAGVSLISPFVGRIMDWYKKSTGKDYAKLDPALDPGVISVTRIFNYYKTHGYKTVVMGASFRNAGEIINLTGCDKITISPGLLAELQKMPASKVKPFLKKNAPKVTQPQDAKKLPELTQAQFLLLHNSDAMGLEKLAEGIRNFYKDTRTLEAFVSKLQAKL